MIAKARQAGWMIAHIHIAFASDYSDLPRNCRLFRAVESFGAMKRDSWGAAALEGFDPHPNDVVLTHACNNAFQGTGLEAILRERDVKDVAIMGLATQYSVEHTVRHAADIGLNVTMIRDCCGSANSQAAEASFAAMAMLAEVRDSEEIAL